MRFPLWWYVVDALAPYLEQPVIAWISLCVLIGVILSALLFSA